MDALDEVRFWGRIVLEVATLALLASAPRVRGRGWLIAFLWVAMVVSAFYYVLNHLHRADAISYETYRSWIEPGNRVTDVASLLSALCLMVFVLKLRAAAVGAASVAQAALHGADRPPARDQSFSWLLFSFQGRMGRGAFWAVWVPMFLVNLLVGELLKETAEEGPAAAILIGVLWLIGAAWVGLAIQAKRWHDRDKSAWMILVGLIPIVGWVWVLIEVGCLRGTVGDNRFGPDPAESA